MGYLLNRCMLFAQLHRLMMGALRLGCQLTEYVRILNTTYIIIIGKSQ